MPLNYSKWDNLEVKYLLYTTSTTLFLTNSQLSDDSDIEGHPNVDKKSLIRCVSRLVLKYMPHCISQMETERYSREA